MWQVDCLVELPQQQVGWISHLLVWFPTLGPEESNEEKNIVQHTKFFSVQNFQLDLEISAYLSGFLFIVRRRSNI